MTFPILSIVTGVCGNIDITRRWFDETITNCALDEDLFQIVIVSNGNTDEENDELRDLLDNRGVLIARKEPLGSSVALNLGIKEAAGKIVACLHNDLMITQKGWDEVLVSFFENTDSVGLVGLAGAKQIGAHDIYTKPYELTQLGRAYVFTSLEEWQPHGSQTVEPTTVAVLDGMAICGFTGDLLAWGGFDENFLHHMYDNDISITALKHHRKNYVLPLTCNHISGQTANFPRYNDWLRENTRYASDGEVHQHVHKLFYDKHMNGLPIIVA